MTCSFFTSQDFASGVNTLINSMNMLETELDAQANTIVSEVGVSCDKNLMF